LAYNILSCLLHAETEPAYKNKTKILPNDISEAENYIKIFIGDFKYSDYLLHIFNKESLIALYKSEINTYYKLQIFRVILEINNLRGKIEDPLLKYIDEQFHVENDYIFYLDLNKYDIVPDFVIPKCDEFLVKQKLI
jgi:hypothetical protein